MSFQTWTNTVPLLAVAAAGGYLTSSTLRRDNSTGVPSYIFPIVWTVLYAFLFTISWRMESRASSRTDALRFFGFFESQLACNALWSFVATARQPFSPYVSTGLILLMLYFTAMTIPQVRVDTVSLSFTIVYIAWLCVALVLSVIQIVKVRNALTRSL